jgi:putative transcriptional regulator
MRDPNFRRTILLLSSHDAENGAHGLVLNRPAHQMLSDVMPVPESELLAKVPVFVGGPVATSEVTLVNFGIGGDEGRIVFHPQVTAEQAAALTSTASGELRAYLGYAGWSKGQLESEITQNAWVIQPATVDVFVSTDQEVLWYNMMKTLGPAYHLLAMMPDDPSLN